MNAFNDVNFVGPCLVTKTEYTNPFGIPHENESFHYEVAEQKTLPTVSRLSRYFLRWLDLQLYGLGLDQT